MTSSTPAWCIITSRKPGALPLGPYATLAEAEAAAVSMRRLWPQHACEVRPDPQFRIEDIPPYGLAATPAD